MKFLQNYIRNLLARGKYFFSAQDAISQLKFTPTQFRYQAYRLSQKKMLRRLYHGFFMIPPEYRQMGSLPPSWIIDSVMKYLHQDYYIGLLSAASMYGATEQQPMSLQVITTRSIKSINLPRGSVDFHVFKECASAQKNTMTVYTGNVFVSSKEQTIVDLIRFYKVSGHLSNVAHVIKSLAETSNLFSLNTVVQNEKTTSVLQRLGYIFDALELTKQASIVERSIKKRKLKYILLRPEFHIKDGEKNSRWKLLINDTLDTA
jgi:predicted transcriptional regulator of viral defense system